RMILPKCKKWGRLPVNDPIFSHPIAEFRCLYKTGVCRMRKTGKIALMLAAIAFAVIPLLSQTSSTKKPSFEVISIKPSAPGLGIRGGGARGDRYRMAGATLRMLLQNAYQRSAAGVPVLGGQLQISGGPNWIDSDRWDIEATADCSGGVL